MYHQVHHLKLRILPTQHNIYVLRIILTTNSHYFHTEHSTIGLSNGNSVLYDVRTESSYRLWWKLISLQRVNLVKHTICGRYQHIQDFGNLMRNPGLYKNTTQYAASQLLAARDRHAGTEAMRAHDTGSCACPHFSSFTVYFQTCLEFRQQYATMRKFLPRSTFSVQPMCSCKSRTQGQLHLKPPCFQQWLQVWPNVRHISSFSIWSP